MNSFHYDARVKNRVICIGESKDTIHALAKYIMCEHRKGKIPLIIVGAGVSASHTKYYINKEVLPATSKKGLPSLSEMVRKISEIISKTDDVSSDMISLKELFFLNCEKTDEYNVEYLFSNIDREWLSKTFTTLANSKSKSIRDIWREFCDWFLFGCIDHGGNKLGALTTTTSLAAEKVRGICDITGALCFSANFDNYVTYAMDERAGELKRAISIFSKKTAQKYFIRTRRSGADRDLDFEAKSENRCVLHANGDVFWLSCSGNKIDGYCPRTGKYLPAFNTDKYGKIEDLKCEICGSDLNATMTMPGTYEKDYNTRDMVSTIWKNVASKISCIITVGLSCNWDDVLLKFIIALLSEKSIPHIDINNFSDPYMGETTLIVSKIVKDEFFESACLNTDAEKGLEILIEEIEKIQLEVLPDFNEEMKNKIRNLLAQEQCIKRLKDISQIGLKAYWKQASKENDRWGHSQGVAECALDIYNRLHKNSRKRVSSFEQALLYFGGLLHDCGHLPFSHLLEDVFAELSWKFCDETESFSHNHYTAFLIKSLFNESSSELKQIADAFGISYEEIIAVVNGNYGLGYIDGLINSEIDADKIEYIFMDASQTNKNLMLSKKEFQDVLLENAYITQEGLIAYDSGSAWIGLRLLDERKRLYSELYFDNEIRCLEAAAKFIITTYFVQKYNKSDSEAYLRYVNDKYSDLSHCRIMMAIEDLFEIIEFDGDEEKIIKNWEKTTRNYQYDRDLHLSLSSEIKTALKRCMDIAVSLQKSLDNLNLGEEQQKPKEIIILETMYYRLTNQKYIKDPNLPKIDQLVKRPYIDRGLQELSTQLTFEQLNAVKKKISINFPGVILIDVYRPTKYLSPAKSRRRRRRLDGTYESQTTILVPSTNREEWLTKRSLADQDINDYVEEHNLSKDITVFNVFRIGADNTMCDHTLNMLKKEMKRVAEKVK